MRRGEPTASKLYFSPGDGLVMTRDERAGRRGPARVPYPFATAEQLLEAGREHGKRIADLALANECIVQSPGEIRATLLRVADAMRASIERGLSTDGTLPGGRVRRAPAHADALRAAQASPRSGAAVFATAVAEENAAGGRVVASPSNGAAGPVAALLTHFRETKPLNLEDRTVEFLLAAAAIAGVLRASGLVQAGCQSEVGLAAAMAAAGYAAVMDGTNAQVLLAAELALEPHLGLACDPEGARIQQPCIERNATAASRAVTAAQNALRQHAAAQRARRADAVDDRPRPPDGRTLQGKLARRHRGERRRLLTNRVRYAPGRLVPENRCPRFPAAAVAIARGDLRHGRCAPAPEKPEEVPSPDTFECTLEAERWLVRFTDQEARLLTPQGERINLYQIPTNRCPLHERLDRAARPRHRPHVDPRQLRACSSRAASR